MEVYYNGTWGAVCGNGWDIMDAEVVCRELGFPGAAASHCCSHFGEGTGPVWLDNVGCAQTHKRLAACDHRGWGVHSCSEGQNAGVVCQRKCSYTYCILHVTLCIIDILHPLLINFLMTFECWI